MIVGRRRNVYAGENEARYIRRIGIKDDSALCAFTRLRKGRFQVDERQVSGREIRRDIPEWQCSVVTFTNPPADIARQHHITGKNKRIRDGNAWRHNPPAQLFHRTVAGKESERENTCKQSTLQLQQ